MTVELVLLSRVAHRGREITGTRLPGLLALLAADLGTGAGTGRLVAALWPDEQPEHPAKALQVLVSRARARLGADLIASTPAGYRLTLTEDQVDASAVLRHAATAEDRARAGDHAGALAAAEAGLALCAGAEEWAAGLDDPLAELRAARLPAYRSLLRARALALSRLGRRAEAVGPLTDLARDHLRDEEILAELLRCEAATAGPAAALARYDTYRRELRDELGSDPGPVLRRVHQDLLRADAPEIRRGLRHEPNPLLGRDHDVTAVLDLVRASRVTSIVGPGGLGKTRLAHAVGRRAEQRVVHFVALAGVTADEDVAGEVASALGAVTTAPGPVGRPLGTDVRTGILTALGPGPALLVLDNCEQVVAGVADLVRSLVAMSADLRVLTTSRAPLGLSSESVYPLSELDLSTTVELFGQRARAARPGIDLPEPVVRELCAHLDGLPLAVELAAARVRVLSVAEIARRLDDRFAVLRGNNRDAPPRHRTLAAVIEWSWNLLDPDGRAALSALSVFPDGFTADAAGYLLDDADPVPLLEKLADQSLLKVVDTRVGTRFRMLETVREFAAAQRTDPGVTGRFVAWARDFGRAHHDMIVDVDLATSFPLVRAEQDNLLHALRYALDHGDGATVATTSAVLGALWIIESNFARMTATAAEVAWTLSHYRPEPECVEAAWSAATLCALTGFLLRGPSPARALVALRRFPPGKPDTLARAMHTVFEAAIASSSEDLSALAALCDDPEPLPAGLAGSVVSYLLEERNDIEGALAAARGMLAAFQGHDIRWLTLAAHSRIGELSLELERADEAVLHFGAVLSGVEELGATASAGRARWVLVLANLRRGAVDEAERWLASIAEHDADRDEVAALPMASTAVRAEIALLRGDVDTGLRRWREAAERLRDPERTRRGDLSGLASWPLQIQADAVIAHARHGRLDLVSEIVDALPRTLTTLVMGPLDGSAPSFVSYPVFGDLLLALAMADIERGAPSGVRLVALAERFGFPRTMQPTVPASLVRRIARDTDGPAYDEAVSSYAGLDRDGLREAAAAALLARDRITSGRA